MRRVEGKNRLAIWLRSVNLSDDEAAKLFGISREYLSMLRRGDRVPSIDLGVQIERITGGIVKASSFVKKRRGPPPAPRKIGHGADQNG